MPDPTYKTFLSPGSCQLEVTDLVASANDDTGVDLYGVAWEIEQVLIAGEGFAASPTDMWVNERGILNIGQSLFDKINRTAEDNDNIPGQCTVVVKATSLVDSSKVARLKVLVGYPGEAGGGGGLDVGDPIRVTVLSGDPPVANETYFYDMGMYVWSVLVGDAEIIAGTENSSCNIDSIAVGANVICCSDIVENSAKFYEVTIGNESLITAVTEISGVTHSYITFNSLPCLSFTVPEISAGKALWVSYTLAT